MATHNDTARHGRLGQRFVAACGGLLCLCAALALAGCGKDKRPSSSGGPGGGDPTSQPTTTIEVSSSAFAWGSPIPKKHAYTGEGQNISPPLAWRGEPAGTKEFALIVDDPDAPVGTWVHWVLYKIPATTSSLPEGAGRAGQDPAMVQGKNSWKQPGYGGPMPPPGKPHRYFFRLYALDAELDLKADLSADQLRQAIAGHVLATGELMGTYQR